MSNARWENGRHPNSSKLHLHPIRPTSNRQPVTSPRVTPLHTPSPMAPSPNFHAQPWPPESGEKIEFYFLDDLNLIFYSTVSRPRSTGLSLQTNVNGLNHNLQDGASVKALLYFKKLSLFLINLVGYEHLRFLFLRGIHIVDSRPILECSRSNACKTIYLINRINLISKSALRLATKR